MPAETLPNHPPRGFLGDSGKGLAFQGDNISHIMNS
jgi:hypothetical protein